MIFEDNSGRRWRRLKWSGIGVAVGAGGAVTALGVASVIYLPQWRQLSVPELGNAAGQVAGAVTRAVVPGLSGLEAAGHTSTPKASPSKSPAVAAAGHPAVLGAATAGSTPAPSAKPAPAASEQPAASPAPKRTPTPTPAPSSAPGNSTFGHTHH